VTHHREISRRHWLTGALAVTAFGGAALAGCDTPPARNRFPELTYGHLGRFRLDVERIDVVSEFKSDYQPPHIEQSLPVSPEQTMRRWAADRLIASGSSGRYAQFVIQDASVTDTPLPRTEGLKGAFTTDQTNRYDASFAARLEIRAERGNFGAGTASAQAKRSRTIPEGITLAARDRVWFELVEATMNDLNAELDRQIRANLPKFLVETP
jgi:hypothetical protein